MLTASGPRRTRRRRAIGRIVAAVTMLSLTVPALASAACRRASLTSIENTVMCQVCGVPLGLATQSPEAVRERAFISNLIARCQTASQIRAALVAQYGPSVLASPPTHGFALAAYLVPLLGLACAGALLTMVALAWRGRERRTNRMPSPSLSVADSARVDAALDRFEP